MLSKLNHPRKNTLPLPIGGLLGNGGAGDDPYHVQLGKHAFIGLSQKQIMMQPDGGFLEKWNILYQIGVSACSLELTIIANVCGEAKGLLLQFCSQTPKWLGKSFRVQFLFRR
ncbi:unnamed protein product [Sphenostylis stenocarpa]|uniref:Uncharacterized protein n=1 Tax=Sphenostylis stenocarpa TaxID=92480 RepID=A0AA86VGR1_9FABA|nr:unnamed protein product [Sphenostylis stenocarpa]